MEIYSYMNFGLGVAAIGYGLFTLVMRVMRPDSFWTLEPMKERWVPTRGKIIHVIGYTVMPLVFGAIMLTTALVPTS